MPSLCQQFTCPSPPRRAAAILPAIHCGVRGSFSAAAQFASVWKVSSAKVVAKALRLALPPWFPSLFWLSWAELALKNTSKLQRTCKSTQPWALAVQRVLPVASRPCKQGGAALSRHLGTRLQTRDWHPRIPLSAFSGAVLQVGRPSWRYWVSALMRALKGARLTMHEGGVFEHNHQDGLQEEWVLAQMGHTWYANQQIGTSKAADAVMGAWPLRPHKHPGSSAHARGYLQ